MLESPCLEVSLDVALRDTVQWGTVEVVLDLTILVVISNLNVV